MKPRAVWGCYLVARLNADTACALAHACRMRPRPHAVAEVLAVEKRVLGDEHPHTLCVPRAAVALYGIGDFSKVELTQTVLTSARVPMPIKK